MNFVDGEISNSFSAAIFGESKTKFHQRFMWKYLRERNENRRLRMIRLAIKRKCCSFGDERPHDESRKMPIVCGDTDDVE